MLRQMEQYRVTHEPLNTQFMQHRMRGCAVGCLFIPFCRREREKLSAGVVSQ